MDCMFKKALNQRQIPAWGNDLHISVPAKGSMVENVPPQKKQKTKKIVDLVPSWLNGSRGPLKSIRGIPKTKSLTNCKR